MCCNKKDEVCSSVLLSIDSCANVLFLFFRDPAQLQYDPSKDEHRKYEIAEKEEER